ncbi:hypothetical protein [Salipiger bermudensis]|uniref:hypothetical protein n=1 Tax=Salipiger bermudensis TaxID=344736 RepID=UPI001CD4236C|nr:hypothetical protein [Salipiger bermudensis]MCA0963521.1 hypothetical protein [Salipiger bermudensis]
MSDHQTRARDGAKPPPNAKLKPLSTDIVLAPGGRLGPSPKHATCAGRNQPGRCHGFRTEDDLHALLADVGLTLRDVTRGTGRGLDGSASTWISVLAHD